MTGETADSLGKGVEELAKNRKGHYTIFERCDEEAAIVGTSHDLEEIKARADSMAMQNNPEIKPEIYNKNSRDGILDSYFDVYDSEGKFKYTGKIPEVNN